MGFLLWRQNETGLSSVDYHPYRIWTLISFEDLTEEILLKARICDYLGFFFFFFGLEDFYYSKNGGKHQRFGFDFHGRDGYQWAPTHIQTHTHMHHTLTLSTERESPYSNRHLRVNYWTSNSFCS